MGKPVLGAQLFTVRAHMKTTDDFARTMKKVKDIGYTTVQLSGVGPVDPADIARISQDVGLPIVATHMGWDRFKNDLDGVIAEHKMWNCVHSAIGGIFKGYEGLDGVKKFLDELGPIAEKLAAEGLDFSYHNHNQEFVRVSDKVWLAELYDRADVKTLKAEIDVYWVTAGGGDPTLWVKRCAGREPLLHLKDMTMAQDRTQMFAEIGEGNLNWPSILKAAEESGVEYMLVEQDNCYDRDPFESLAISLKNLHAMGYK